MSSAITTALTGAVPSALIADDEPLLHERLVLHLQRLWPELQVVAQARNGREAVERFDEQLPTVAFLDVHMPGLTGIDVARCIGSRASIVFVTAYDQYAVQDFEQGAVDCLVKPFDEARLAATVARLGGEALIRKSIRELADELDPERFVQIHRSVIVALAQVAQVTRGANETADIHLRGRTELLPVSRSFVHRFRQM